MVAAINIGSSAGAFDSSSAVDFSIAALNSAQLVKAVAQVYQKFLGAKQVQTGKLIGTKDIRSRYVDGEWETLSAEETPARTNTLYKDNLGTLFFEIGNG